MQGNVVYSQKKIFKWNSELQPASPLKRQENLCLKMSSVYVIWCIFLQTFQTYFLHHGKQCGPRSGPCLQY